jgi:PadR family transcriptional regulator, regulatory protein PadR
MKNKFASRGRTVASASGASPIGDLDQCVCSGKTLARLLRPAILALLSQAPTHGYVLVQRIGELNLFAAEPPDPSGVYKTVKEMEKEGLVNSAWELGDSGPAKRRYELSSDGLACLNRWVSTLKAYRTHIDGLLMLIGPKKKEALPVMNPQSGACGNLKVKR